MKVKAIFATGLEGQFGKQGGLITGDKPLHGDGQHFRNYTKEQVIVMGRKTWESLPFKLQNRISVVISSKEVQPLNGKLPEMTYRVIDNDLSTVIDNLKYMYPDKDIIFIGGARLIEEVLPLCDEVSYTVCVGDYPDCDVFIPQRFFIAWANDPTLVLTKNIQFNNVVNGLGDDCQIGIYKRIHKSTESQG